MTVDRIAKTITELTVKDSILWERDYGKEEQIRRIEVYLKALWGSLPKDMPNNYFTEACSRIGGELE